MAFPVAWTSLPAGAAPGSHIIDQTNWEAVRTALRTDSAARNGGGFDYVGIGNIYHQRQFIGGIEQFAYSSAYNFALQAPGENLSPSLRTVTLAPVPPGVNGSDVAHYVGIYNNAGVWQENALINGGTAVAGSASGTLTFASLAGTRARGTYKIGSASAGIAEAIAGLPSTGGKVMTPSGSITVYATVTLRKGTVLHGVGSGASTIEFKSSNTALFHLINDECEITGMKLNYSGSGAAATGCVAVSTSGISGNNATNFSLTRLHIVGFYNGIIVNGCGGSGNLYDIQTDNCQQDGIIGRSAQGWWSRILTEANKGNGCTLTQSSPVSGASPYIDGFTSFANGGWGLWTSTTCTINGFFCNNDSLGEMCFAAAFNQYNGSFIANGMIQFAGSNPLAPATGYTNVLNAPGINIAATGFSIPVTFVNVQFYANNGNGVELLARGNKMIACDFQSSGVGAQAGYTFDVKIAADAQTIVGCVSTGPWISSGGYSLIQGNQISMSSATLAAVNFTAGVSVRFIDNYVGNAGGGAGFTAAVGTSFMHGTNIFAAGSVSNLGTLIGTTW